MNRIRALAYFVLLAALPALPQAPPAADQAHIRAYIHNAWDTLSRSMYDCKSIVDPKVHQVPVLYLPADLPTPPAVETMRTSCNVDVRHLPRIIQAIGEVRPSELPVEGLLYLPNRYVVPGGRFNEMYGWDSYFILLGLEHDGRRDLAKGMVENFFFEIANYGAILNANRTYYFTRSQPPFLSSMIREVYEHPAPSLTSSGLPAPTTTRNATTPSGSHPSIAPAPPAWHTMKILAKALCPSKRTTPATTPTSFAGCSLIPPTTQSTSSPAQPIRPPSKPQN